MNRLVGMALKSLNATTATKLNIWLLSTYSLSRDNPHPEHQIRPRQHGRWCKHVGNITPTNDYDPEDYSEQDEFEMVEYNMITMDVVDVTDHGTQSKEVLTQISMTFPECPNYSTKRLINMIVDMGNTLPQDLLTDNVWETEK